jgi:hypothetical protein
MAVVTFTAAELQALAKLVAPLIAQPPVIPPVVPPTGALWVYHDGVFHWGGDYSWGVTIDYKDPVGKPGGTDIAVTGIGGFQPYANNFDFDPAPYKFLTFSLKPTIPNQQWQSHFYAVGDIPMGAMVDVLKFGPVPQVGKWATYTIPLGAAGYQLPAQHVYKFMIQDQTADQGGNTKPNLWYVDEIYFS